MSSPENQASPGTPEGEKKLEKKVSKPLSSRSVSDHDDDASSKMDSDLSDSSDSVYETKEERLDHSDDKKKQFGRCMFKFLTGNMEDGVKPSNIVRYMRKKVGSRMSDEEIDRRVLRTLRRGVEAGILMKRDGKIASAITRAKVRRPKMRARRARTPLRRGRTPPRRRH